MLKVIPSGQILGATIEGLDLAQPLQDAEFDVVLRALGEHGVIRFPRQHLSGRDLANFSARFGELEVNVANSYQEPGIPEVMILSNIVENGRPIGLADAGQGWHTDMSYSRMIAFANVLYGIKIPQRYWQAARGDGIQQHACGLRRLARSTQAAPRRHDGAARLREVLGDDAAREGQQAAAAVGRRRGKRNHPCRNPIFLTHPLTGRKVLYANPGYSVRINELPEKESDETLEFLFEHQLKPEYRYVSHWQEGDVLMWEDIGTIHNAVADYGPDEHRLVKRCQVMADRFYREGKLSKSVTSDR